MATSPNPNKHELHLSSGTLEIVAVTSQTKNKTTKPQKASTPAIFSYPISNIIINNLLLYIFKPLNQSLHQISIAGYYEVF